MAYNTWASYNTWGEVVPVTATLSFTNTIAGSVSQTVQFTNSIKEFISNDIQFVIGVGGVVSNVLQFTTTIQSSQVPEIVYDFSIPAQRVTINIEC